MSRFIEQATRDLRWLIQCPELLESPLTLPLPDPFLSDAPLDFSPVERFLETKASHRVGYYVESLIQVWLEATPGISEVEQGIQIREEKETLGELDFLFRREGELHHLEVALKFYLYSPDHEVGGSHFIGPNAADTFERKRDHLLNKQIPLGKRAFPEIVQSHLMVKGMIFYRVGQEAFGSLPEGLNPDHARGRWIRSGEEAASFQGLRGVMMKKPYWLADPEEEEATLESGSISDRGRISHPRFLHLFGESGDENASAQRLFVVPEEWGETGI